MFSYDSYMLADDQIQYKNQRLLAVDHKLYLPVKTHVRLLITSADVLHS
jgi:heme/copper-type cytochrome/quinol oxidase subunit 2